MTAEAPAERRHTATVGWFELFYDLVVVAAIAVANDDFLTDPSFDTARDAVIAVIAMSWVWLLTTLVNNIFPGEDLLRRILMLAQMALIVVGVLTIDQSLADAGTRAMLAYGGALLIVPLLVVVDRWVPRLDRPPAPRHWGVLAALTIPPALCALGAVLGAPALQWLLLLALAVSGATVLGWLYRQWWEDDRLRLDHLRERLGLFVLIILGEGFAQLVAALHGLSSIPRTGSFALLFLVSFALWWIYFDGLSPEDPHLRTVRWRLALLGHLLLVFGIAATLDILVLLAAGDEAEIGEHIPDYFAFSVALVLLSFALLRVATRGGLGATGALHVVSAAVVVVTALLIDDSARGLNITIVICAAVVIVNGVATGWTLQPRQEGRLARARALIRGGG